MSRKGFLIFLKCFGLWLVGALVVAIVISQLNLVRFYRLKAKGVQTIGVVTDLQPNNASSKQ